VEIPDTRSIDRIFEEVKEYAEEGTVVTTDASLADALNARLTRLDKAFMGDFCTTPRRYVSGPEMDEREDTFLKLVNEKDLGWRQSSYLLEKTISCWQYTGELEKIKQYERFDSEVSEKVIDTLKQSDTVFSRLEEEKIEGKVIVVGFEDFTGLDKKLLPDEFEKVEMFTGEKHELSEFRIFESKQDIVQSLTENIKNVRPEKAGVVVNPESQYQPLIEASLDARDIPYLSSRSISEESDLRSLISLLRVGLSTKNVRVRDVRPVLDEMDVDVRPSKDNRLVSRTSGLEDIQQLLNVLEYLDFNEVLRRLEELGAGKMQEVNDLLDELDLLQESVSSDNLSDLEFYIESFDPSSDSETDGVLFADPSSAGYVDRPVVFFIGVDKDWTRETGDDPWINEEKEAEKNRNGFCSLIQSGEEQVYMVQDKEMNREVKPCYHLGELAGTDINSFEDLDNDYYRPEGEPEAKGFKHSSLDVEVSNKKALSQSALNDLALSPKLYYFRRLTSDIEDENLEKGNIFHDYAEFYATHPDFVEEISDGKIIEAMKKHMRPFMDDYGLEQLETELRIGLSNITEFLEQNEIERTDSNKYSRGDDENIFAETFGKEIDAGITEMSFMDTDLSVKGKIDLIMNEKHLVDYKSGRKKSAKDIVKASNVELYEDADWPDFQALMYLTFHRDQINDQTLKFTFLNFLDNISDAVNGDGDNGDNAVTVRYVPKLFDDYISSLEMYEHLLREKGNTSKARKVLDKLGCENFREFFKGKELEYAFDKDKALKSKLAQEFQKYCEKEIGEYKYVRKGTDQIIKEFVEVRCSNFFSEDLDNFKEFVDEKKQELNHYLDEGFPLNAKPDDLPDRDMILDE